MSVDRVQLVWLSFGVVAALAGVFAMGFVVGGRAERILPPPPPPPPDAIAQLDADDQMHRFYTSLTRPAGSVQPAAPSARGAADNPAGPGISPQESTVADSDTEPLAPALAPASALASALAQAAAEQPVAAPEPVLRQALNAWPPSDGDFTVQVSSFATEQEADAYAAALRRKGYRPFVVAADIPDKGRWYRVRMGAFSSHDEAVLAKRLLAQADIPAWVLRN